MRQVVPRLRTSEFIAHALQIGAIAPCPEGRVLSSGRVSPYFFDVAKFNTCHSLKILGKTFASVIAENFRLPSLSKTIPQVIFGPAYKGVPIAVAVTEALGGTVGYAFNRKEQKDHGEGGEIVGASIRNQTVLLVDDCMTSGETLDAAAGLIKSCGGILVGCVVAFDRQEHSLVSTLSATQQFSKDNEVPVFAVATASELLFHLKQLSSQSQMYEQIIEYFERYRAD